MHSTRRLLVLAVLAAALALSTPAAAGVVDSAVYQLKLFNQPLGREAYELQINGDTLVVYAQAQLVMPGPNGPDSLIKSMRFVAGSFDSDIRRYESWQRFRGQKLDRAILTHDTTLVVYREVNGQGSSDSYARPPGRLFVLDGQIFSSFEVMCRALKGRAFTTKPLNVFVMSKHDSLMQMTATDLGTEVTRWGNRQITAHKLRIGDGQTDYTVWTEPAGRMIRLEQPEAGLRLDREPPAARQTKRPAPH